MITVILINSFIHFINSSIILIKFERRGFKDYHIELIAENIKKLHNVNWKKYNNKFPLTKFDPIKYWSLLRKLAEKNDLDKMKKYETKALQEIAKNNCKKFVICHNDLSFQNFIFNKNNFLLIDFEYSSLNDPCADYASFIVENILTPHQIKLFLELLKLNENDLKRLQIWIDYLNITWYYWAKIMYKHNKNNLFLFISNLHLNFLNKYFKDFQKIFI